VAGCSHRIDGCSRQDGRSSGACDVFQSAQGIWLCTCSCSALLARQLWSLLLTLGVAAAHSWCYAVYIRKYAGGASAATCWGGSTTCGPRGDALAGQPDGKGLPDGNYGLLHGYAVAWVPMCSVWVSQMIRCWSDGGAGPGHWSCLISGIFRWIWFAWWLLWGGRAAPLGMAFANCWLCVWCPVGFERQKQKGPARCSTQPVLGCRGRWHA
jgi:hypothetical protein